MIEMFHPFLIKIENNMQKKIKYEQINNSTRLGRTITQTWDGIIYWRPLVLAQRLRLSTRTTLDDAVLAALRLPLHCFNKVNTALYTALNAATIEILFPRMEIRYKDSSRQVS